MADQNKGRYHDPGNPIAYMEVSRDGEMLGKMRFELFGNRVPITVENFRAIISGENKQKYSYVNTKFHRIIGDFMA